MAKVYSADEVVARLRKVISTGAPLFVPNCGSGLTAKLQEMGGSDMIVISGTSYWRLKGQGSLAALMPNSDINQIVFDLAPEIVANVKDTPILSLSGAFNPLIPHKDHLRRLRDAGVSGINPFMIKIYGDATVAQMDNIGIGWKREVEFVEAAANENMFALAYAFTPEEARVLAEAGAHAIATHFGSTVGGITGAASKITLEEATERSQEMFEAALAANPDIILFAHGGPIEGPRQAAHVMHNTSAHGFIGGSAAERVPIEKAVLAITKEYKNALNLY
ncbi:MAG: phosphoenolpyruvate hydrolase family protein [Actinobacteria bacterium]|jgi:predicted TIM-barrel enzyme|nr:phosphoenolpyruvate hydrolase family protein [Actinomycetota bacterium]